VLKLKPIYQVVWLTEDEVWLYRRTGQSLQLKQPGSDVTALVKLLLHGTDWQAIEQSPQANTPGWLEAAAAMISSLDQHGAFIQSVDRPANLSDVECARFAHQLNYFAKFEREGMSRYDYLNKLRQSHVLMLGLGSLGSSTLQHLVAAGIGRITALDMDRVELHNLTRAVPFVEGDVALPKVDVAARILRNSRFTAYRGIFQRIDSARTVSEILESCSPVDLVLLTADTPTWGISVWTAEACRSQVVPMVRGNRLGLGPLTIPDTSACPACDWPRVLDRFPNAGELVERHRQFGGSSAGVLSPAVGVASSVLAHEMITFLSGAGEVRTLNAYFTFELEGTPHLTISTFLRDPRCPVCGAGSSRVAGGTLAG
jgi:molybdopterin/thiamine biosynthesis adenylyltransferase